MRAKATQGKAKRVPLGRKLLDPPGHSRQESGPLWKVKGQDSRPRIYSLLNS